MSTKPEFADKKPSEKDMLERIFRFGSEITLWASPEVLRAFAAFKLSGTQPSNVYSMLHSMDRLYRTMRIDIGLSNDGLEEDFFIKMMLSNPSEIEKLKQMRPNQDSIVSEQS